MYTDFGIVIFAILLDSRLSGDSWENFKGHIYILFIYWKDLRFFQIPHLFSVM
jgi:hypothetical protein